MTKETLSDSRDQKNLERYLLQMTELKSRLGFISTYENKIKDRFVVEMTALQIRKIIELIAFSLISIHHETYKKYRANVGEDFINDWNGRDIINNLLKLNPDFLFKPILKEVLVQPDGTKDLQLQNEKECYTLKRLSKLYDRCGGILHVMNPWKNCNKVESFHGELKSIIKKLNATFEDHVILINHWSQNQSTAVIF